MPNAVSNQCGPVMMGSMDEEQTVVEMAKVSVANKSYALPRTYSKTFDGVNFERDPNYSRKLEDVTVVCEEDTLFNDDFGVDSYIDKNGDIGIKFSVNSEVNRPAIWYNGNIHFGYDSEAKAWSMIGSLVSREWKFCRPDVVIDTLISAIECFSSVENDEALKTIRNILADNRADIIAGVNLYRDDCKETDEEILMYDSPAY